MRKNWIEELPVVLWSIRMMPNRATGQTPFALVYGAEAVLPTELVYGSPRVLAYDALDLLYEQRDVAAARSAIYQQDLRRYHSRRVKISGSSRIKLICTSYPHLGKDLLWSAKICTMGHTTSLMFESTKIHVNRRRRPSGRGI